MSKTDISEYLLISKNKVRGTLFDYIIINLGKKHEAEEGDGGVTHLLYVFILSQFSLIFEKHLENDSWRYRR